MLSPSPGYRPPRGSLDFCHESNLHPYAYSHVVPESRDAGPESVPLPLASSAMLLMPATALSFGLLVFKADI